MELYAHQQQTTTTQQQADSMATVSSSTNGSTNSNNNSEYSHISSSSNTNSNSAPPTLNNTVTADAATVAIAKDMLQLHHGGVSAGVVGGAGLNNASSGEESAVSSPALGTSNSASTPPAQQSANNLRGPSPSLTERPPPENALAHLKFNDELLYITETCTIIGRNSSTSLVHFHVAENNLVSRKHFQILYDSASGDFYVQCLSKNGIFVDDFLQRRNADPLQLPESCFFRFPSTEMRIHFESYVKPSSVMHSNSVGVGISALNNTYNSNHSGNAGNTTISGSNIHNNHSSGMGNAHVIISPAPADEHQQHSHSHHLQHHSSSMGLNSSSTTGSAPHLLPIDNANVIYSPLKISIPKKEQKSPYLSPTGTISAANSCPASPRQGFQQNQSNYNNYSNNNLQNQDLFQTPSTASYNHNEKPPYSYAQLIVQAISAAPDKQLTLSGIYSFIVKHYPYYRKETNKGWQNSIRHNLSLNRYFIKVARSQDEPGKGSFWRIDPDSGAKLIDHSYKKRRQRSSQGFRPSYGMPRSAPVSPSHMDNSRESSPLQDIVLQSAPGSPGMSMENRATESDLMYNSQHQSANNSHNQYNSGSPYYVSNQNTVVTGAQQAHAEGGGGGAAGSGNGVGALIALKRNHVIAAGAAAASAANMSQQHQLQGLHPDIIYEEMPTDYSGNIIESDGECEDAGNGGKRPKYISEVL